MAIPTKQALLQALSGAEGRYISGEQLAQTLGVSRAAIHKAAAALTTQGYTLEAAPRRGYRLLGGDPFCADAVGEYPAPVYVHERLDSSNQTAKRLALAGARQAGHAVSLVLNVGVAGSMDLQRAPLRSLWRVEEEIWPEYGLHDGTAVDGPSFGFPQWEGPHGPVFDRLPLAAPAQLPACLHGLRSLPAATSLSVAGVSASRQRVGQLRQAHPGALLENMEGFAVALACARQGIACVEVRSVSNRVGPRAPHETDFPGAMRRLADIWRPAP